ncbi:MAG: efflux RND transporter periplasmic adaptor subunit [Ruminococcus sp.]|nr:efflux RND transporter periplasmic adaptor subunit [Ruminococcus sp.]
MSGKKRAVKIVTTVIVIAALGVGGFFAYKKFLAPKTTYKEKVYVQKVSYVNTVTNMDMFSNSFAGVIVAQKTVDVKYDTSKTVDEILVSEGQRVSKGDKVLTYNLEAIQLDIDTAKLEVERLENEIATNEDEIKQLEEEKKKATEDGAVTYTTQILSLQSDNARNEYDIKAKNVEIQKLEASTKNAYVVAPIDGTVTKINDPSGSGSGDMYDMYGYGSSDSPEVIMKITADGEYRVKGTFNELNGQMIGMDVPVILKSRVDDTQWGGVITEIDTSPQTDNNNMYDMYGESDEQTTSSKYLFYVTPDSLDGFMLGQHIIIEIDNGQSEQEDKTGIWIYKDFIVTEGSKSYVWAKDKDGNIEKRTVKIGKTDEEYGDVEIVSGLSTDDYIAFPADYIKAGMATTTNISDESIPDNIWDDGGEDYGFEDGEYYDDGEYEEFDFEAFYGITEEEFNNMTEDEQNSFLDEFYANFDYEAYAEEKGIEYEEYDDGEYEDFEEDGGAAAVDF